MSKHLHGPNIYLISDLQIFGQHDLLIASLAKSGFQTTPLCCWYSSSFSRCLLKYPQTFFQFLSNCQPCFQISSLLFNSLRGSKQHAPLIFSSNPLSLNISTLQTFGQFDLQIFGQFDLQIFGLLDLQISS